MSTDPHARRLVILRHAKSVYPPGVVDIERPLGERGERDAVVAGTWIRDNVGVPDHVIVSPSRRTRETWGIVARSLGYVADGAFDPEVIGTLSLDPRVYEAPVGALVAALRELPDRVRTAVLVGHNPGCAGLAHHLAGSADPVAAQTLAARYPTSGIAVLDLSGEWSTLDVASAHLAAFVVPRG